MAGFVVNKSSGHVREFHIGDPDLKANIVKVSDHKRVIVLQLDGDELDAALWGLENYRKGQ